MASRILGMGDVLGLIEEAQRGVDQQEAEKLAKKMKSGKSFDLNDFKMQFQQMKNMGGMSAMLDKLPSQLSQAAQNVKIDDKTIGRTEAIINSMTSQERTRPELLKASRKRRVAAGAGVTVQEVNRLLAQFEQAQKMMKMISKGGGMAKMLRGMKGMLPGMR
jgi:signal recognition particle subunit SRP54